MIMQKRCDMAKVPDDVINELKQAQTIGDMFDVLRDNYDLELMPSALQRSFLITGLIAAIEAIQPVRKSQRSRRRIFSNKVQSF